MDRPPKASVRSEKQQSSFTELKNKIKKRRVELNPQSWTMKIQLWGFTSNELFFYMAMNDSIMNVIGNIFPSKSELLDWRPDAKSR